MHTNGRERVSPLPAVSFQYPSSLSMVRTFMAEISSAARSLSLSGGRITSCAPPLPRRSGIPMETPGKPTCAHIVLEQGMTRFVSPAMASTINESVTAEV